MTTEKTSALTSPLDGPAAEQLLQRVGLAAIVDGELLDPGSLGERAGLGADQATAIVDGLLSRESVTVDADGRVDGIAGLTVRPSRHQITPNNGEPRHTWCAFDAVGIPAALGWTATSTTTCGHCGAPIEINTIEGRTAATLAWGWLPSAGGCGSQLITEFCSTADLFCTRDHLDQWHAAAGTPPGQPFSVADLADLGRAVWAHCTNN